MGYETLLECNYSTCHIETKKSQIGFLLILFGLISESWSLKIDVFKVLSEII